MRFDIRLIVASNVRLEELRERGESREDLYYGSGRECRSRHPATGGGV